MGKKSDLLHHVGSSHFLSRLWTYTKWVKWFFVILGFWFGHGRTFLDHCQLVLLQLVILPIIWRVRGCLLHSELIVSMLPESHMCRVFVQRQFSLCRPSQRILSYISWPSLVSSCSRSFQYQFGDDSYTWSEVEDPSRILAYSHFLSLPWAAFIIPLVTLTLV